MAKALYPGTFDPITLGHIDIIERALHLFDEVTIAIATSAAKKPIFTLEERIEHIDKIFEGNKKVKAIGFTGLVVDGRDFARVVLLELRVERVAGHEPVVVVLHHRTQVHLQPA